MRIIASMVGALARGVAAILKTGWDFFLGLRSDIARLLGRSSPPMPEPYIPETSADDVLDAYRDRFMRESEPAGYASDAGRAVHQYAAASDPWVRGAVDISGLTPAQTDWLLGLKDADLERLAKAGPKACDLAARGRRCGVVGLPVPSAFPSVHVAVPVDETGPYVLRPAFA
jgi:hypothetical protein